MILRFINIWKKKLIQLLSKNEIDCLSSLEIHIFTH
jgi:hypothetical protein